MALPSPRAKVLVSVRPSGSMAESVTCGVPVTSDQSSAKRAQSPGPGVAAVAKTCSVRGSQSGSGGPAGANSPGWSARPSAMIRPAMMPPFDPALRRSWVSRHSGGPAASSWPFGAGWLLSCGVGSGGKLRTSAVLMAAVLPSRGRARIFPAPLLASAGIGGGGLVRWLWQARRVNSVSFCRLCQGLAG